MDNLGEIESKNRFDSILFLVIFFIFFIFILFTYLIKVNGIIYERGQYDEAVSRLPIYDEGFNNFFLKSTSFNNYDVVNKNINRFEDVIELLKSKEVVDKFGIKYTHLLKNLERSFESKKDGIERFKSQNALLISSIHYLLSLNNAITDKKLLDSDDDTHRLNKTMLDIMAYYINPSIDKEVILKNIDYFTELNRDYKLQELYQFINHANINYIRIYELSYIRNKDYKLAPSIEELRDYMTSEFDEALYNSRIVVTILFVIAIMILIVLFLLYKRSLKIKDDLISFKTAVENSYNSIVITDIYSNIVYVNDMAVKETGYSREELIGQNPRILKSGDKSEEFYKNMHERLDAGQKWEGEFVNVRKNGSEYYEKASIMPIFEGKQIVYYLAIKMNITDYILQQRRVEHMAYHDALTDLPNRISVEEYLEHNIDAHSDQNIAILFIDIDNFKTINDSLGHDIGDNVIIECSKQLKSLIDNTDILARTGGDEFLIVIPGEDPAEKATEISENIIKIFQKPIETKNYKLSITLSIGISIYPDDSKDYKKLFKYADTAMYEAKERGRNNYQFYKKKLSAQMHERLEIEQALKYALAKNEIYTVYQPKYDIATKNVIGIETLVRWKSEELGIIRPDRFIPISEGTGDILDIGLFIFKTACNDFFDIKQKYDLLESISINVSTVQLYNETFIDDILKITKETGMDPKFVIIEITETHVMKNINYSISILKKLKNYGFSISIDDFGTGHSSLNYLKRFPIDELKIDKSFIDDLPQDSNDAALTKTIISLSKNMGYKNVSEGIETKEQENFLLKNGCRIGQGFLFSRPREKDNLIEFLKNLSS